MTIKPPKSPFPPSTIAAPTCAVYEINMAGLSARERSMMKIELKRI